VVPEQSRTSWARCAVCRVVLRYQPYAVRRVRCERSGRACQIAGLAGDRHYKPVCSTTSKLSKPPFRQQLGCHDVGRIPLIGLTRRFSGLAHSSHDPLHRVAFRKCGKPVHRVGDKCTIAPALVRHRQSRHSQRDQRLTIHQLRCSVGVSRFTLWQLSTSRSMTALMHHSGWAAQPA
jgi:hypothetical protein